jgi:uncharacterized protein YyaL (SSP411 family)
MVPSRVAPAKAPDGPDPKENPMSQAENDARDPGTGEPRRPNRLAAESSPYLRQHALNPVDWFPWGEEALEKARREDKPVFLSIGYSACHWCHVMERESFEDGTIAAFLNEHFVPIKVDREERPDLDDIYMSAVQLMSGQGGWPLSAWLTPAGRPFFGGTYFPPVDRWGRAGFLNVLERLAEIWRTRREEVETSAGQVTERVASFAEVPVGPGLLSASLLAAAVSALQRTFDRELGGFGGPPKFPHSMGVQLLLRHHRRTRDLKALEAVTVTLDRMAAGGIYDHLGGGFHRYSVDARWLVPHFEKMLYDQALLAVAYLDGYLATGTPRYAEVVRETLDWVIRDLQAPAGGIRSTLDADSEGEEGLFYTWTPGEIEAVLGPADGTLFAMAYDCTPEGNFEGRSILHPVRESQDLAAARLRLREVRERRPWPARDDKVLAGWNGLMISAFARAGAALEEPRFVDAARKAAGFILDTMERDGLLLRVSTDGVAKIPGYLEDYAALAGALVDLYEADFDPSWLAAATRLVGTMQREFADPSGGFFNTSERHGDLLVRVKNGQDGSTPSGNSLAAGTLLRLGRITGRGELEEAGAATLRAFQPLMEHAPGAFHQALLALDFLQGERAEVAVIGPRNDPATLDLLRAVRARLRPGCVVAWAEGDGRAVPAQPSWLEGKTLVAGRPAAYVCRDYACAAPVTTVEELERLLAEADGAR